MDANLTQNAHALTNHNNQPKRTSKQIEERGKKHNKKRKKMMFDCIMVCLVRKGLQEFVDGTDASSQLHAPCSQQSVTVELVKIPTVTRNGFLTNNGICTKPHTVLNCTDIQESTGLKMKKIVKEQKSFLFRRIKNHVLSFFGQPDLGS